MSTNFAERSLDLAFIKGLPASPWTIFDNVWTTTTGYSAEKFHFIPGKTAMSTLTETAVVIATYYVVIIGGRELMRSRPAFKLSNLFLIHNFYLTAVSAILLVLFVEQLVPTLWNNGVYDGICGAGGWTDQLETLYYLNYITKYIELLDTVFLVLKKKPLTFLHCYHHGATALLCYTQLRGHTSVSWVPITLNLMVHVVMYWYYFQSARGIRVAWKEWITRLQIAQFVIDLGFVYFASWNYFASAHMPILPHVGTCSGEEYAAVVGCVILSSYLLLFISFYFATYKHKKNDKRSTAAIAAGDIKKAAIVMEKTELPSVSETSEKALGALKSANDIIGAVNPNMLVTSTGKD